MKLRMLLTQATNVEIQNRKYRHKARDNGFHFKLLHVMFDSRKSGHSGGSPQFDQTNQKLAINGGTTVSTGCWWCSSGC